jgi:hypothetical protein
MITLNNKLLKTFVQYEIEKLKIHATPEQISKLDFTLFNPASMTQCIYGQMAGSCVSEEACL